MCRVEFCQLSEYGTPVDRTRFTQWGVNAITEAERVKVNEHWCQKCGEFELTPRTASGLALDGNTVDSRYLDLAYLE